MCACTCTTCIHVTCTCTCILVDKIQRSIVLCLQFEHENEQLLTEMNSMMDEVRQIEGKVLKISRLQEIFDIHRECPLTGESFVN